MKHLPVLLAAMFTMPAAVWGIDGTLTDTDRPNDEGHTCCCHDDGCKAISEESDCPESKRVPYQLCPDGLAKMALVTEPEVKEPQGTCIPRAKAFYDPEPDRPLVWNGHLADYDVRMERIGSAQRITFIARPDSGAEDPSGETRLMRYSLRPMPDGAPPCDPPDRLTVAVSTKSSLIRMDGRAMPFTTKDAAIEFREWDESKSAAPKEPHAKKVGDTQTAEIYIRPVNPPHGSYPKGTVIDGDTIYVPDTRTEIHFEIGLRR